jgi:hypothetical protein
MLDEIFQGSGVVGPGYILAEEQLLHRNLQRFRGGLAFKAHRLSYYSTLGLRVMKRKGEKGLSIS